MPMSLLPAMDSDHRIQNDDAVQEFREHGHVSVRNLATPQEVAAYRPAIREATMRYKKESRPLAERDTTGKAFLQVTNLWQRDERVAEFVLAGRFAAVAARLLGVEKVRLYHDQALYKEPGGGQTPWHQDAVYWPLDTDLTVTMWMPLVDITPKMGGLVFASGTHQERALGDHIISDDSQTYYDQLLRSNRFTVTTPEPMTAGDATFHAGWTLHRALANESESMREVMTVIWVADGARVAEALSDHQEADLRAWLPGLSPGDLVEGDHNPLLPR